MEILDRFLIALALITGGVGLYWAWTRWQLLRLRRARATPLPGLENFQRGTPGILYFTTPTCVPCRTLQRPALQRLQSEWAALQIIEIDVSTQPAIADHWGVLSAPTTFILDAAGQPRHVNHGVAHLIQLRQQLRATVSPHPAHPLSFILHPFQGSHESHT